MTHCPTVYLLIDHVHFVSGGRSRLQYKEYLEKKREKKRLEKKNRMKELFDKHYDAEGNEGTYFDHLKSEMESQAQVGSIKWYYNMYRCTECVLSF